MSRVLTLILAGGEGERLFPLTRQHAKPGIPFGGVFRLIDIPLSNCINSGLRRMYILTQHKAFSLNRHIRRTWNILPPELGEFIEIVPPMKRMRDTWYLGTADAVYQNLQTIEDEDLPYTLILSADHVYKMDYAQMLAWHVAQGADVTLATTQVAPEEAARFGIVEMSNDYRIQGFEEKPAHDHPARSRFNPEACSASMGVYLFSTPALVDALKADAEDPASTHDFGHDVLPNLIGRVRASAYDFVDENRKASRYWRDVGTIDAYFEANLDLVSVSPEFNLYDREWPIFTATSARAPAKFVFADEGRRMGVAVDSMISHGCIISGGRVARSILSPGVRVNSYCVLDACIVFENVNIGRYSHIRRAVIDADLDIPEHTEVGLDPEADRRRGHFVTDSGIVVLHAESPGVRVKAGAAGGRMGGSDLE